MNEHDLLDAMGGIDPKFIKSADSTVSKYKKLARIQSYYFAAAGLLLLVVAGIVIRNAQINTTYESVDEAEEITTLGAIPKGAEEGAPGVTESSPVLTAVAPESDYPAMLMHEGSLYKDSGEEFIGEIPEDSLLMATSYTDGEPSENGQQNFDRSSETKFFVLNEDAIVVRIDPNEGIWRIFLKQ